jgi:hypothetical protein
VHTVGDAELDPPPDSADTSVDPAPDALPDTLRDVAPDTPPDTEAEPDVLPPDCPRWYVQDRRATSLVLVDPVAPNTERSFRIAVDVEMSGCQRRAMPHVEIDEASSTVTVTPRAWDVVGMDCPTVLWFDTRHVVLRLRTIGTWTVVDPTGEHSVEVEIGAGPPRPCASTSGMCEMDCDCPHDGSVCLGGHGLGGPFTRCAHPCEDHMDCMGGQCLSMDDGLELICVPDVPQCDGDTPCPTGYRCEGGVCRADFTLGSAARVACICDDDCDPPLACTMAAADATSGRCEVLCPTGSSRWCSGPHYCGPADEDISGLALTDSVCIWVGD